VAPATLQTTAGVKKFESGSSELFWTSLRLKLKVLPARLQTTAGVRKFESVASEAPDHRWRVKARSCWERLFESTQREGPESSFSV